MFTGIISHTGKFVRRANQFFVFEASESICKKLTSGISIAVNGVCLTVSKPPLKTAFSVALMPETIKMTMLGNLQKNDLVNLELPVTPESFLAGHIVQGHVDGTGIIDDIALDGNSRILKISVSPEVGKYIVEKGSIAVSGISLTVIKAGKTYFTVGIIPYTWEHTVFAQIKIGDMVNIETDILAKYIEKLI
jgi:riboflavin synthase